MKNYIYLFGFGLLMFLLTFIVAFNFFDDTKEQFVSEELEKVRAFRKISEQNNVIESTSYQDAKIAVNAKIIIEKNYIDCGHITEVVSKVENDMVGLNEEEFRKKYSNFEIKEFSNNEIKVEEKINGICNEHFKIRLGEDFVEVFKLDEKKEEELYYVTGISRDYLAQKDIDKLDKGVDVYGRENINSMLEDYE